MKNLKRVVAVLLVLVMLGSIVPAMATNLTELTNIRSTKSTLSKTAICIHFHYPEGWHAGDPLPQKDVQMIQKAKDLNAKYIRFDIWWKDIEPQKDQFNENAIAYYKAIINKIHQEGMDAIVVLGSSGGFPNWVKNLLVSKSGTIKAKLNGKTVEIPRGEVEVNETMKLAKESKIPVRNLYVVNGKAIIQAQVTQGFLLEAKQYAAKIAQEYWYLLVYYQLGNELNHPTDPIDWYDDHKYIKALHDGLDEYEIYYKTIVNAFADWSDWRSWDYWLEYWLDRVGNCIDVIAIDHYPGTWSDQPYNHWNELDTLFNIADQHGKQAAVMETGFSTYSDLVGHGEDEQRNFINSALPAIRQKAQRHYLAFVTWYELVDEPWQSPVTVEWYFGICRDNLLPKLGYNDLKYQFSLFGG